MNTKTEHYSLESDLILRDRTESLLVFRAVALALTRHDEELIECRLTFQVSPELYQRIETEALFNLKPQVRGSPSGEEFLPSIDINIETSLQPDLLPYLAEHSANIAHAASYILNLSKEQPDNPLLSTESWLALSVKQLHESGETGYRTFWAYISPSVIAQALTSSEEMSEITVNFFNQLTKANLSAMTQKVTSNMLEEMTDFFKGLTDATLNSLTHLAEDIAEPDTSKKIIFEEMIKFFKQDDWPIVQLEGKPILQMAFQGENEKWTCYAKARVEQEQFVFYSVCPVNAPENKRLAIAEFLTRANSGMIIGNFELDFADGEIRYKTSIDVQGDFLSFELIKQLVYANVTMMDEYLPGIKSVIEGDVSPVEAIAQIEG
jgi:hypothetical protein